MADPAPILAANLARSLSALTRGLTYPSESDFPFEPFWTSAPLDMPLTPETFRSAAGIARRYEIRLRPARETLDRLVDMWSTEDPHQAAVFRMLAVVMDAAMTGLTYAHAGGDNIVRARVFLFGRVADGRLAGLRSVSIET
ncbi:MAG TPA: nuclease A inhibitor family protein [Acidimicrobiales bacterium]|nr:nuclease A inhibitor family protein [Acidimicrobiales bacterium]